MGRFETFQTELIQSIGSKEGAISPTISPSASYGYASSQEAEGIFAGTVKKPLYARVGNPTSAKLEQVLAQMDGGIGAIATSSGMGAISLATLSLLSAGDEIISIGGLFGGTYAYFKETLSRFSITTHFFDVDELQAIEEAINDKTKILFLESVGNPNLRLPDIQAIAQIAKTHAIALIVDNTTTPLSIKPLALGADIVVYSTTKLITGNASALGGAVIFRALQEENEKFTTSRYRFLSKIIENMGKMALVANGRKRALRDFGMSANAYASHLTLLGLETLPLRMDYLLKSVEKIAAALFAMGLPVRHPSLPNHEHHARYKEHFFNGCGPLLTLDAPHKESAFSFLDSSQLVTITANIGDSRTLGLHMASTIYRDFTAEDRTFLGISEGLIRLSIGLESSDDIIEDFMRAYR